LKVALLVAGMAAGADSVDDMAMLLHGGMRRVWLRVPDPVGGGRRHRQASRPSRPTSR
jgi:hypothetical protein